jgi:hypothetical protein
MSRFVLLLVTVAFTGRTPGPATAQQRTPFAGREVPDPSMRTVEPLSPDVLGQVPATTPSATPPAPQAAVEPSGEAADAATTAAVSDVTRQLYARLNGGDTLRALALFTDPAAGRFLASRPDLVLSPANATPPACPPEAQVAIVSVTDVRVQPDGRVFAFVTQDDPTRPPNGPEPIYVLFTKQDDHWLIDDFQPLSSQT